MENLPASGGFDPFVVLGPRQRLPQVPFWFAVEGELMYAYNESTAPSPDPNAEVFEVVRGVETGLGTRPRTHLKGAPATVVDLAGIYVHSKMMIVDDVFVSIGSANINRRGLYHDGEINVFSVPQRLKAARDNPVASLRRRLWAEMLDLPLATAGPLLEDPRAAARLFDRAPFEGNRFTDYHARPARLMYDATGGDGIALILLRLALLDQFVLFDSDKIFDGDHRPDERARERLMAPTAQTLFGLFGDPTESWPSDAVRQHTGHQEAGDPPSPAAWLGALENSVARANVRGGALADRVSVEAELTVDPAGFLGHPDGWPFVIVSMPDVEFRIKPYAQSGRSTRLFASVRRRRLRARAGGPAGRDPPAAGPRRSRTPTRGGPTGEVVVETGEFEPGPAGRPEGDPAPVRADLDLRARPALRERGLRGRTSSRRCRSRSGAAACPASRAGPSTTSGSSPRRNSLSRSSPPLPPDREPHPDNLPADRPQPGHSSGSAIGSSRGCRATPAPTTGCSPSGRSTSTRRPRTSRTRSSGSTTTRGTPIRRPTSCSATWSSRSSGRSGCRSRVT